jgi:drug/metabolite transporter (DMT)-like permease
MSRSALGRLALLAGLWGCSFLFIKVALEGLAPAQIVLGRMVAGALVLLAVMAVRRQPLPRQPGIWGHFLAVSAFGNVLPFLLFAWGEQRISSSRAGVLNATTPLCTLLCALLLLPDERPTANRVAGLVVGFAGVVVLVAPWADASSADLAGQVACLVAAACYGVSFTYTRRFLSVVDLPAGVLAAGQLTAGAVVLVISAPFVASQPVDLNARIVLSVLALGALGTGVAYLIFHGLVRDTGATTASMVTYLIPVTAVILGVIVLGESVSWNLFAGAIVIIAGVALAEDRFRVGMLQAALRRATMLRRT